MKKAFLPIFLLICFLSNVHSQSVFGYWYGNANVKLKSSSNNYLVELVLQQDKGYVKGMLNYYFKNIYRSIEVKGNYSPATRQLNLYDIPVTYHGSIANFEVDCIMNFLGTLMVAKAGSRISGRFLSLPEFKYMCPEISFNLSLNADISKKDSVLKAISEYKEAYQVWTPSATDTLVTATIVPRKVINYVTEKEYSERKNVVIQELEVDSDTLNVDVYDNGEIDGDIISVFYNQQLILSSQKLTHRSIKLHLPVDSTRSANEISMFAENLGLIPPNTALMVIHDGKTKYEIRISSSLETNATIRLKRRGTVK